MPKRKGGIKKNRSSVLGLEITLLRIKKKKSNHLTRTL